MEHYYKDQRPKTTSRFGSCTGQRLLVFKHIISITRPVPLTLLNFNFEQGQRPWEKRYIGQRRLYIQEKFTLRANIFQQYRSKPRKEFIFLPCVNSSLPLSTLYSLIKLARCLDINGEKYDEGQKRDNYGRFRLMFL